MNMIAYVRESLEELRKVSWPSRAQTMRYSLLIIAISVAVAIFFGALDWALQLVLEKLVAASA